MRPTRTPFPRRHRVALATACGALLATPIAVASVPALAAPAAIAASTTPTDSGDLFDSSTVHQISVEFDQADYEAMIEAYQSTGDKEWISATVTIDGTTYENVGLRLKGNSSLAGLGGGAIGGPGGPGGGAGPQFDFSSLPEECASLAPSDGVTSDSRPAGGAPQFDMIGGGSGASADDPTSLPWLIRLDKYVEDQNHDGETQLVVRSNITETALNEAVSLELLEAAGLATEQATPAAFSVNGSDPVLRLVIENPNGDWTEDELGEGMLYKADASGDYSYRGDDPEAYTEAWDQEAGTDDLTPLIEFLDFINNADDETFAAEIGEHLDIAAFAEYMAIEDLLQNGDDIDGPGNNSYLYYDPDTRLMTVVAWDHNLALTGGGMMFAGPGGGGPTGDVPEGALPEGALPEGAEECGPFNREFGPGNAPGGDGATTRNAGGPVSFGAGRNVLVQRITTLEEYTEAYDAALADLQAELIDSGLAQSILDEWVSVLTDRAADLIDPATVEAEAQSISEALAADGPE